MNTEQPKTFGNEALGIVDKPNVEILSIQEFKVQFDKKLTGYLDGKINKLSNLVPTKSSFLEYLNYVKDVVTKKGKRIRPYLAYLTYTAFGGKDTEEALGSFVALELVHSFSLIHDDIMDNAFVRRRMKTPQAHIADELKEQRPQRNPSQTANSYAILLGDIVFSWANEVISKNPNTEGTKKEKILENFYTMLDETAYGQAIDLDLETQDIAISTIIEDKIRLKTASPIIRSMLMGVLLADQDTQESRNFCQELGLRLGIIYQTQDDLSDVAKPDQSSGKTTMTDITRGQHTHLSQYVFEHGTENQKTLLRELFGANPTEETRQKVQKVFSEAGAIKFVQQLIEKNVEEAKRIIENLPVEEAERKPFFQLVKQLSRTN